MLSQTKEQLQDLVGKVQLLDFILQSLSVAAKDYDTEITDQFKRASFHKLKLTSEILRLAGVEKLETKEEEKEEVSEAVE